MYLHTSLLVTRHVSVLFKCAVDPVGFNADGSCLFKMVSPQVRRKEEGRGYKPIFVYKMVSPQVRNRLKIECRRYEYCR